MYENDAREEEGEAELGSMISAYRALHARLIGEDVTDRYMRTEIYQRS